MVASWNSPNRWRTFCIYGSILQESCAFFSSSSFCLALSIEPPPPISVSGWMHIFWHCDTADVSTTRQSDTLLPSLSPLLSYSNKNYNTQPLDCHINTWSVTAVRPQNERNCSAFNIRRTTIWERRDPAVHWQLTGFSKDRKVNIAMHLSDVTTIL